MHLNLNMLIVSKYGTLLRMALVKHKHIILQADRRESIVSLSLLGKSRPEPPVSITSLALKNTVVPKALNKVVLLVLFALKELMSCQLMSLYVFV